MPYPPYSSSPLHWPYHVLKSTGVAAANTPVLFCAAILSETDKPAGTPVNCTLDSAAVIGIPSSRIPGMLRVHTYPAAKVAGRQIPSSVRNAVRLLLPWFFGGGVGGEERLEPVGDHRGLFGVEEGTPFDIG